MRINFTPLYISKTPARQVKSSLAANSLESKTLAGVAFRGYFNDPDKYNPKQDDSLYYFCEHLEEGEKPKRGQSLCGRDGKLVFNRNVTSFFRDDINWMRLGAYLKDKYRDEKRLDTRIYACSNGLEPYSFSALIQKYFPNDCEKFFPIIAKDISEQQIKENKVKQSGDVKISADEAKDAKAALSFGPIDDFYKYILQDGSDYIIKDKVKAPVVFEAANILDDLDSVNSSVPTIFVCRNMWPYVDGEEHQLFSDTLYEKLASGSIVIIGEFDYTGAQIQNCNEFADSLIASGFSPVYSLFGSIMGKPVVFEKK